MECPRCTSDLDRQTDDGWRCPACGLEVEIPVSDGTDWREMLRDMRDGFTLVAELMVYIAEKYPETDFARDYPRKT